MQFDEVRVAFFDVRNWFDVVDPLHCDRKEPSTFLFPFFGDAKLYCCIHLFGLQLLTG